MKATETKVEDFLSTNKTQFVIPVYQRNYDWSTSQCKQLLDDILEVGSNSKMGAHFIGSIVYVHDDLYQVSKVKELTIIDGQQRLTTLTLIYLVLYWLAKEQGDEQMVDEISETYLINKYAAEEEKLKLRPTENNDQALKYLLRSDPAEQYNQFSKLVINFNYFKGRITKENRNRVVAGLSKLMFVEVSLDKEKDDPQRIFESLNSTGLELTQADLIRNYILMGLNRRDQTKIYHNYWEIIEQMAKDETNNLSKVSDFIRDYLTLVNKTIPNKAKVYWEFKERYPRNSVEELELQLADLKLLSKHYHKLLNPRKETDAKIRANLESIQKMETNVAYPFLMKVYDDYSKGIIDLETFLQVLELIQSFVWRRFILGLPTNALNKIFMNLYDKVQPDNYLASLQNTLMQRTGVQRFPRDAEFVDALRVRDVYNIKSKNRTYLLERLENFENREPILIEGNPDITIEHIFPQTPDNRWKQDLSTDEFVFISENYLNTIANLTLSGNNGKLSNKPFLEKRDLPEAGYRDSRLWMNRYLSGIDRWNREEIENRFVIISERALKIWAMPDVVLDREMESETNIFDAGDPIYKKLEYAIFLDKKLTVTTVSRLYAEVLQLLFEEHPDAFVDSELGETIGLTNNPIQSKLRQPVPITNTYYIEGNVNNTQKFEKLKQVLTRLDLEEELIVKFDER